MTAPNFSSLAWGLAGCFLGLVIGLYTDGCRGQTKSVLTEQDLRDLRLVEEETSNTMRRQYSSGRQVAHVTVCAKDGARLVGTGAVRAYYALGDGGREALFELPITADGYQCQRLPDFASDDIRPISVDPLNVIVTDGGLSISVETLSTKDYR